MTTFSERYNTVQSKFNYDSSKNDFISLQELLFQTKEDSIHTLRGLYINTKSMYGDAPVAVIDGLNVNLPSHMLDTVRDILNDDGAIADINNELVGFKVYEYHSTAHNRECYSIKFVDITPEIPF